MWTCHMSVPSRVACRLIRQPELRVHGAAVRATSGRMAALITSRPASIVLAHRVSLCVEVVRPSSKGAVGNAMKALLSLSSRRASPVCDCTKSTPDCSS